jgi:putative transposase
MWESPNGTLLVGHRYTRLLVHCVFATQGRRNLIPSAIQPRLWAYIGGVARANGVAAIAVGGASDHVHMLIDLAPTVLVAKTMQVIKAGASKWLRAEFPTMQSFAWQEGYGAFSVGAGMVERTVRYIETQDEHHRMRSFDEEFALFAQRHGL